MDDGGNPDEPHQEFNGTYCDVNWLMQFPLVSPGRVLSYFASTPFFDPSSVNQNLVLQGIDQTAEQLVKLNGVQFMVDEALSNPPNLFVITKLQRYSPNSTDILDYFACVNGTVMKCSNFQELVRARVLKVAHALDIVEKAFL